MKSLYKYILHIYWHSFMQYFFLNFRGRLLIHDLTEYVPAMASAGILGLNIKNFYFCFYNGAYFLYDVTLRVTEYFIIQ